MYCIYLRKSRADKEAEEQGQGETLERHLTALTDYAQKNKFEIGTIYKEIVSGDSIASRPEMQHLLSDVEAHKWQGVLVMDVDRLARGDTIDQGLVAQTFKLSGTLIITPTKTYNPNNEFDEEYFEFGLFMSRREYKIITRRLQRGRLASINEGKYVGNKPPYGYDRVKLAHEKGYTLSIVPNEADVVRMIFDMYTKGIDNKQIGISIIVNHLNELRIKPRYSDIWTYSTVRDILQNPTYKGYLRWNYRPQTKKSENGRVVKSRGRNIQGMTVIKGIHEAIISEKTYQIACDRFDGHDKTEYYKRGIVNPLSGLVRCSACGHIMTRRTYKRGYPDALMCTHEGCHTVSSQLLTVETAVLDTIRGWAENYDFRKTTKAEKDRNTDFLKRKIAAAKSELKNCESLQTKIYSFLESGVYTADEFRSRSSSNKSKISDLLLSIERYEKSLSEEYRRIAERDSYIPMCRNVLDRYDEMPPAEQNDALKLLIQSITYTKTAKNKKGEAHLASFTLQIIPRIQGF